MFINTLTERWVTISGHPNYEVSNYGRVRKIDVGKILAPRPNLPKGYLRVYMDGKRYYVHRLVAEAFLPLSLSAKYIRHIDGDILNNSVNNLEWCSKSGQNDDDSWPNCDF